MKNSIIIPSALQLCIDDIGWFNGADERHIGRPSRTGMPRKHVPEDYTVLNEIGKALDMKIICPLILGEWDKDNLLRNEVGATFQPFTWDRASLIDYKIAEKSLEVAENSEFIEYAYHGLLHGTYDEKGNQITECEFFEYKSPTDKTLVLQTEDEILHRMEIYYKIYDSWGFKKKIHSFSSPTVIPQYFKADDLLPLASALEKNGIYYWTNRWKSVISYSEFIGNVLYLEKNVRYKNPRIGIPWNAYDFDPNYIMDFAKSGDDVIGDILSTHWPNYLRFNYQKNLESVEPWVRYLKKQSEVFGLMLSKDIVFCGNQHLYKKFTRATKIKNIVTFDVSEVSKNSKLQLTPEFYVSFKNGVVPQSITGGSFELYETHKNFITYKIKHTTNIIQITVN